MSDKPSIPTETEVCNVNCSCKTGEDCHPDGALNLFALEESGRNFTEDYPHENGNYLNICMYCDEEFIGHKRRVCCKLCEVNGTGLVNQI